MSSPGTCHAMPQAWRGCGDAGTQKVIVFEKEEYGKVQNKADGEKGFLLGVCAVPFDQYAAAVGDDGRGEDEQRVGGLSVHVEKITGTKQKEIAVLG